jgi:hypothetical protein
MLSLKIAKWKNNADAPVIFMIDDLCNKWVDLNGNGKVDQGEDWGYAGNSENSSFRFLENKIMDRYPELKVTFFSPVGIRSSIIQNPSCDSYSAPINDNEEIKDFFRRVHSDERYEIAYHGLTHGIPGHRAEDFRQEWESFNSIEEAIGQIEAGKNIFFDTLGELPLGGKYCGYRHNELSDESIDKTGFFWWCRDFNRPQQSVHYVKRNEPEYFGSNRVIDIPTTLEGNLFCANERKTLSDYINRFILRPIKINRRLKKVEDLLSGRHIISILEHIAPSRTDYKRQMPNIFDDLYDLYFIFDYLKEKNVWYSTCSDVANYYEIRENTRISNISDNYFHVEYKGRITDPELTIVMNDSRKLINRSVFIVSPDDDIVVGKRCEQGYRFNIKVMEGIYRIKAVVR